MDTYENIDEFLKLNNIDRCKDFELAYKTVVKALNYDMCKQILLNRLSADGISIKKLKDEFLEDRHLNYIYKIGYNRNYDKVIWTWDIIGEQMLRNIKATVRFRLMSDSCRTCIAKECARMVINEAFGI